MIFARRKRNRSKTLGFAVQAIIMTWKRLFQPADVAGGKGRHGATGVSQAVAGVDVDEDIDLGPETARTASTRAMSVATLSPPSLSFTARKPAATKPLVSSTSDSGG